MRRSKETLFVFTQIPLVVLANKQDLPGAIDLKNMEGVLQLHNLPPERSWHVQVRAL